MVTTPSLDQELRPIAVTVQDYGGTGIPEAHVRATYLNSGLSIDAVTGEKGDADVPLLYCDKEPMRVDAVAQGYHAETVSEYRPDAEGHKLLVTLEPLKSEWEQLTIPLHASNQVGSVTHPVLGHIQVSPRKFWITNGGEVSVNGRVASSHGITMDENYYLLMKDGTELTVRFLEIEPKFSVTLEFSPPRHHSCSP